MIHGNALFAGLAMMRPWWFVSSAHATKPWTAAQLFDFVTFCVIKFWPLNAHT